MIKDYYLILMILVGLFLAKLTIGPLFGKDFEGNPIVDPSISERCQDLIDNRISKIKHKEILFSLVEKNLLLQKKNPHKRESIKMKLEENFLKTKREIQLTQERIQNITEDIVKKGCPGIIL
jgi:hypothetical protein